MAAGSFAGLTRRDALTGAAACAVAALAGSTGGARASAPHTFSQGGVEITVLSDGHLDLPRSNLGRDVDPALLAAALKESGQTGERIKSPTNVTLIRAGNDLILVDVGAGPNFMDTAGKLPAALEAAGIDPRKVTKVLLTHGHPDHLWGAVDEFDDSLRFPNAEYVISQGEWALWMTGDPSARVPADRQSFIPGARRNLTAIKDRIRAAAPGTEVAPGITMVDTAGHTQGHVSYLVAAGSEQTLVLGDAMTNPVISVRHPDWRPPADHDPERAIATRKALVDRLAADKARVIGYHFPFPGIGRIERTAQGPRFVAGL